MRLGRRETQEALCELAFVSREESDLRRRAGVADLS